MYCIIWNYKVEANRQGAFEKEYSRTGTWFRFFESCEDFLGIELMKEIGKSSYLVIDKWSSKPEYEAFIKKNKAEYDELTRRFGSLYSEEQKVGEYGVLQ